MAKKTKKEKIIAQYRRKMKLLSQLINQKESLGLAQNYSAYEKEITEEKSSNVLRKKNKIDTETEFPNHNLIKYLKADFKKSSLIFFFIIALEFFIYFVMIKK